MAVARRANGEQRQGVDLDVTLASALFSESHVLGRYLESLNLTRNEESGT